MKRHTKKSFAKLVKMVGLPLAVFLEVNKLPEKVFAQLTWEECENLKSWGFFRNFPPNKVLNAIGWRQLFILVNGTNIMTALRAYADITGPSRYYHNEKKEKLEALALDRLKNLGFLEKLETFKGCLGAFKRLIVYNEHSRWKNPLKNPLIKKCEEKLIVLAQTPKHWQALYRANPFFEDTMDAVTEKINEQISQADTIRKLKTLYLLLHDVRHPRLKHEPIDISDKVLQSALEKKMEDYSPVPTDTLPDLAWLFDQNNYYYYGRNPAKGAALEKRIRELASLERERKS